MDCNEFRHVHGIHQKLCLLPIEAFKDAVPWKHGYHGGGGKNVIPNWEAVTKSSPKSHPDLKQPLSPSLFIVTHEEGEVEEAEDVFGARGAAVGHHDEVEVARSGDG